ncbi:SH3 domain-containing protein [Lachnellula hyalina]|uniref:SH3 domain-containing protein n=1 Tax=Lachnellula hyalina TaxID=1316788 RepID=A0A8H8R0E7_9HELO|nr:SH3 domain-containing protein [Lachnellula hyalina]TVY26203.1 SH3 domain-containing protein [Lachnellula hyalina]
MQKVTSILPSWDKTKTGSKKGFDKAWQALDKLGAPVNKLSNKIGSEAFWPTTLDKESDKAARILKSFCKDGFYAEEDRAATVDVPKGKQRVLKKIPQSVIENAVGLAIFTTMRTGLWVSGAGGSGVLIARKEDGEWSPPSGILLHTAGLGFLVGVDIYDCVVVINNRKALDSFTKIRATIGGEISAVAGPAGVGGVLENDGKWKQANRPVFTYLKSRGFYAGVQVDGTVIIERSDENERFYGERVGVANILAGKVRHPPYEIKMLMETVKAAEGRSDVDSSVILALEDEPAPADFEVTSPTAPTFGVPERDDPDPFGVLALENAGLEIKEAGTKSRPPSSQFEYNPSPTSPVYSRFHRRSMDTIGTKSNRESFLSTRSGYTRTSVDRSTQTEMGTQTDGPVSPITSNSSEKKFEPLNEKPEVVTPDEVDYTKIDLGPYSNLNHSQEFDGTTVNESPRELDGEHHTAELNYVGEDDEEEEEPVIFEAASAQAQMLTPQAIKARGGVVTIPKRPPPPLPPRSVARASRIVTVDQASGQSPMKSEFEEVDVHGVDNANRKSIDSHVTDSANRNSIDSHVADGSDRRSVEEQKEIVMEDLEKTETAKASAVNGETLEEKVEHALEEQHLDNLTPNVEETPEVKVEDIVKNESSEMKETVGTIDDDEKDDFHSMPTTPNEIEVK